VPDIGSYNRQIITEFRAQKGAVGDQMQGPSLLLLHHRGSKDRH
jgi:hypothetical protein